MHKNATYIGEMPEGEPYTSTRFEFCYGNQMRVVADRYNQGTTARRCANCNGTRLIIYNPLSGARLGSGFTSIVMEYNSLKYGSNLQFRSENTHFAINLNGSIREINHLRVRTELDLKSMKFEASCSRWCHGN